jgi:hypothetical protein
VHRVQRAFDALHRVGRRVVLALRQRVSDACIVQSLRGALLGGASVSERRLKL